MNEADPSVPTSGDAGGQRRLEFEQLIAELTGTFVSLASRDVDAAIRDALRRIGEALALDRVVLFDLHGRDFLLTHVWNRSDDAAQPDTLFAGKLFPWSVARLLAGEDASYVTPDDIPDPVEAASVRSFGTHSRIAIPLSVDGRLCGGISFATTRTPRVWSPDVVARLRAVGQVFGNVLAHKRAAAALKASEQRFRTLANNTPALIWVSGLDKKCTWFNAQWLSFVGRPIEDERGDGWTASLHPDDRTAVLDSYAASFDARQPFEVEYRLRRHDGVYRWIFDRGAPEYADTGDFKGYIGSCIDITDAKESNLRLDLLHRITRAIAGREDLPSMYREVMTMVRDQLGFDFGCICSYNRALHTLTITELQVAGETVPGRVPFAAGADVPIDGPALLGALSGVVVYEPVLTRDTPACQALADAGLTSLVAAPLRVDNEVFGVLIVARTGADAFSLGEQDFLARLTQHVALAARQAQLYTDLQTAYDDLQQTQHAAMQQERLRVIGQMASGVAHDINNGLSPVSLYTQAILENETGLSEDSREYLRTIQRAVDDVSQTLGRLSDFSRRREPATTLKPVDINAVVEQVKSLTRARWRDMPLLRGTVVRLDTRLEAGLPPVDGIEAELRDALTNLVINAIDAMPAGGAITLRTRLRAVGEHSRAVELEVADTGVGMDEETQRRCLEPFFTTKGIGGTGLGLASVQDTVQRHGARLDIESRVGRGTAVRIVFAPAATGVMSRSDAPSPSRSVRPKRILVVDDDPVLLKSLRDVLERDGDRITTASGGREGIEAARKAAARNEPFDAVVTDLAMPYVDGFKVAAAVREHSPGTSVILLTGWSRRLARGEQPPNVDVVLGKPPRLHEVRAALARAGVSPTT